MRVDDLEFRKAFPIGNNVDYYYEIVKWQRPEDPYCYTLLRWRMEKEQPDIQFVGNRPFEIDNQEVLWKLMKYGQDVIQAEYDLLDMY